MNSNNRINSLLSFIGYTVIKTLLMLFFIYISFSCSTTILHKTDLKKDYDFAAKREIGVYTIPSENPDFNTAYSNALQLYFMVKGYQVKDINYLLMQNGDSIPETRFRSIAENLKQKEYLNSNDLFVISELSLDKVFYATKLDEGNINLYHGYNVPRISTNLAIFDRSLKDPVLGFGAVDTARLYTPRDKKDDVLIDLPWMVAGRQFTKYLDQIPLCSIQSNSDGVRKIKVIFWVDKSYRNTFPGEWQNRIKRVALYAGDILRNQFGIELQVYGLNKWDSEFQSSLKTSYRIVKQIPGSINDAIRVGVTYNKSLASNVTDRSLLGLASPMSGFVVMSAQPSFPGMGYWNPIEEAITLVHEIAHAFGAVHVPDENSIMYPNAGTLSYKVDKANKCIFESMSSNYFVEDEQQRLYSYINNLVEMNKNDFKNNLPTLSILAKIIYGENYSSVAISSDAELLLNKTKMMVKDSAYAAAVTGVIEYNRNHWDNSIEFLSEAVSLDPQLAEAHWYLSKALEKVGRKDEAEQHKNIAKPFWNNWIVDNEMMY